MAKILLIEDELSIQQLYKLILTKHHLEVDTADDGEIALQKLLHGTPDYNLILLDLMLPKVDGISVLKQIKAENSPVKQIPVFLITNLGQESMISEALELGAAQYWVKSQINPVQLAQEVADFLKNSNK